MVINSIERLLEVSLRVLMRINVVKIYKYEGYLFFIIGISVFPEMGAAHFFGDAAPALRHYFGLISALDLRHSFLKRSSGPRLRHCGPRLLNFSKYILKMDIRGPIR